MPELSRWVDADDLMKSPILDLAKELRVQGMPWRKIPPKITCSFGVRVSWSCLCKRLTEGAMEKHRDNARRYYLTHEQHYEGRKRKTRLRQEERKTNDGTRERNTPQCITVD